MSAQPIIAPGSAERAPGESGIAARGGSLVIHEWRGSGPGYMHVHHADDEAWHVLEGTLRFRLADREVDAGAGTTVFVPAGVPHTYGAGADARYLIILTPRLDALITELQRTPFSQHAEVMRRYDSEIT